MLAKKHKPEMLTPNEQETELTAQQAADLLSVSTPYFIQLLEEGKIPYRMAGLSHYVKAQDVLTYIREYQKQATLEMNELAVEAQRLGLY